MALNEVTFVKGQGGLGRPLTGEDHISGLVYYMASGGSWPSGFSSTDRIKAIYSLEEAEALGIRGDFSSETVATGGNIEITVAGSAGETIEAIINGISLGKATVPGSPTLSNVAGALRTSINAQTSVHGFTASGASADVDLSAPAGKGNTIHSGLSVITSNGATVSASVTQFSGGVNDPFVVLWYHVKEFFRVQPKGVLYVGIFQSPVSTWDFTEVKTLQSIAGGVVRQVGVYTTQNLDVNRTQIDTLHNIATELSVVEKQPLSILLGANISGIANFDLEDLPDLSASPATGSYVSVVIGQDGNSKGNELYKYTGKSVTCIGAMLGAVSKSKVSENIGWVKNFNLAADELDVISFSNGTSYREVSENQLSVLNDRHYVFLRKHIGITGSYFNDSHTAVSETSDYATIENNRTIDKAIRNIRSFLVPELNGPLFVDPETGYLSEDTSAYFQNLASRPLEQMQRDQELSGFQVIVNPQQNVLSTSKLVIVVKLVPVGVARQIQVNIGFTVNIS